MACIDTECRLQDMLYLGNLLFGRGASLDSILSSRSMVGGSPPGRKSALNDGVDF
jgi:hypothetical protein